MQPDPTKTTHVLYHANCYDGFGSALAGWKLLGDLAKYIPVKYGDPVPELPPEAHVVIADFSWPKAQILELAEKVAFVSVVDHHKTAQADLTSIPAHPKLYVKFDMEMSGATLAWEFFHQGDPPPLIFRYLEDRDLWRFKLPFSREVSACLQSHPYDFGAFDSFGYDLEGHFDSIKDEGTAILRAKQQMVEQMADHAVLRVIGGEKVYVANATVYFSEVGESLCKRHPNTPFAAYYMDRGDGKRQWGLRSLNGFDVSAIAKKYGGGGHAAAAGFVTDLTWLGDPI